MIEVGKLAVQVARELDIANQTLCKWIQKYKEDQNEPFVGSGNLRSEDKEMKEIEKQLRDLKEENKILKKAMSYTIFYNCKRIHGTIGYKTPIDYEKEY